MKAWFYCAGCNQCCSRCVCAVPKAKLWSPAAGHRSARRPRRHAESLRRVRGESLATRSQSPSRAKLTPSRKPLAEQISDWRGLCFSILFCMGLWIRAYFLLLFTWVIDGHLRFTLQFAMLQEGVLHFACYLHQMVNVFCIFHCIYIDFAHVCCRKS